uniref:Synaptonemal complex protein 1 n=1 Tax=Leptobrachium leishanense TaxID=445787 RepID=A0A8C5LLZ1_9ANUR
MLLDLRLQLTESTNKNCVLEEEAKNHGSNLEQYQNKSKELTQQLEEANTCLKKNEDVNRCTTIELENAKESLLQTAKEKETLMEELIKIKEQYIFQMNILKNENDTLNKQLKIDQKRLKETEESLENMMLTVHNKSTELEEITKQKDSLQIDLDSLKSELAFSCKSKIELEQQVTKHKTENLILLEKIQNMNTIHETLQNSINDLKTQATNSSMADKKYLEEITELKAELEQKKLKHRDLLSDNERLLTEKSEMSRSTEITARDMKKLEKELEAKRKNEEKSKKEIETLKENNSYLRKEVESFQEKLEINNEEVVEISKKEKQLKTLDNKLITLKKQVEKKNKLLEEIQQENKSMKKKITEESKQCTIRESEVKQLKVELENARLQYETAGSDKQKEIEDYKLREQQLLKQTEKLKIATDGATRLQEESDIRCQHKIAEIVALMEKHKNQYDKMIEDKDVELERHIAMKQDLTSKKTFLETDLSSTKNEIIFLKEQLKRITEEKEIFSRQVEENKANSGREKNNKLLQTTLETPVQSTKKIDPRNSASFSKRLEVPLSVSRVEVGKTLGERRLSPWNSLRCSMYTPRKTYAVKTPPKYGIMQQEQKKSIQEETTKKKRKVAIDFDFHSDTSEPTDILGFCENEEIFKKLDQKSRLHHFDTTATPKKVPCFFCI